MRERFEPRQRARTAHFKSRETELGGQVPQVFERCLMETEAEADEAGSQAPHRETPKLVRLLHEIQ